MYQLNSGPLKIKLKYRSIINGEVFERAMHTRPFPPFSLRKGSLTAARGCGEEFGAIIVTLGAEVQYSITKSH